MTKKALFILIFLAMTLVHCQTKRNFDSNQLSEEDVRHGWVVFTGPRPTKIESTDTDSVARGAKIFAKNCTGCHGVDGKGRGVVGKDFDVKPPDLTKLPKRLEESYLYFKIGQGAEKMPKWENWLTPREAKDVTHFVRSLRP